ncbi:MAG: hypothetical protein Q7U87_03225 [bacterium]|nr:hypothetical protein [bacterium]
MKELKYLLLLLPFLLAGCREQPQWMKTLQAGDRSMVSYHQPAAQFSPAKPDKDQSRLIEQAKKYFAGHPGMLADISSGLKRREREIIDDPEPGAVLTDDQGNLAITYFGRYESPQIMAGVKVLLVFDQNRDLLKIFVYEVPLE